MGSCHLAERPQEIAPAELAAAEDTPPDSEDRELWGDPIFLASFDKAEEDHHRRKSLGSEQQVHQSPASLPLGSPYRIGDLNPGSFPSSPRWESTDDLAEGCRKEEGDSEAARVDLFGANEPGGADAARDDEQQQEEDDQNSVNPMLDFMHYSCSQLEWVPIRRKDESAIDCDDKEDSDDEEWDGDAGVFSTEEDEQCPESSGTPSRGVDTLCGLELGDWAQEKDILKEGNKEGLSAPKADASMPEDRPGLCVKERQAGTVQTSRTAEPSRMLPPSRKRRHANADVIGGQSKLHRWFHQGNGGVGWRSASAVCGNRKMDEADDEAEQQDPEDKLAMEGTQVEGRMLRLYRDHVHSMKQARARCKVLAKKTIKVPDEGHFTYAFKPAIWQCISNFVDDLDSDRMAGSTQGGSLTQSNLTQCTQMARQPREFVPKLWDICAGIGSLSQGLVRGGEMELVLSIDCNYWANATHKGWLRKESELSGLPPPDVDSIVRLLTIEDLNGLLQKEKLGNSVLPKECDIICGGTPCQGYSSANAQKGTSKWDTRLDAVHTYLAIVALKRPMYVMWENVLGCTDIIKQPDGQDHCGLAEMIHGLHMLGYQYQVFVDDAARYGVPQTRARVILVGAKPNVHLPKHPVATHRTTTLRRKSVAYYNAALEGCYTKPSGSADQDAVTVGEALGDLPRDQAWRDAGPPKSSEPNQPPLGPTYIGEPVHHPGYRCEPQNDFQRAMRRGVGGSRPVLYDHWGVRITDALIAQLQHKGKLAKYTCRDSELSRTVVGKCAAGTSRGWRCIRSDGHFLTVAEFKRLQSIPDHVAIQANNIHSAYLQVGNAVPFLMAGAWGRSIREAINQGLKGQIQPNNLQASGKSS